MELAGRAGLSRPTIRRAIEYLVDRGLLVRKRSVGTQVVHARMHRQVELTSLYEDLAGAGRDPRTRVLSFAAQHAADALAVELGIPAGRQVYVFERLRSAGGEPLALMRNQVPAGRLRLTPEDLEAHGLYHLLRSSGISLRIARQSIGPARPPPPRPVRWARPGARRC
jgi:DNA-binding GntR family transcriptional regulator